jgi:hypothetical protein
MLTVERAKEINKNYVKEGCHRNKYHTDHNVNNSSSLCWTGICLLHAEMEKKK